MHYYFDWDVNKATANLKKHAVSFEQAAGIFLDSLAISVFDSEHSEYEDRWATMGIDKNGILLIVVHTFKQIDSNCAMIRVVSARKADRKERRQYQEGK